MTTLPLEVEDAIDRAVAQFRAALYRMYQDGDIGSVTADCGTNDIRIKATPVRKHDVVQILTDRTAEQN